MSFRQGARQFFAASKAAPPLPYDAEVAWIGSTGYQWIDTGVLHSSPCAYMLDCRATPSSNEQDFFGSYVQPTGACVLGFYGNFIFGFNPPNSRIDTPVFPQAETDFYLTYSFAASTRTLTVNGQSYQGNGASFNGEKVMLFCGRTNGGIPVSMKCRAFRIERDGVAVFDGISVRFTNEQGQSEGAMYDRVSMQLFRNAGTGAFTIGPDKVEWTNPYVTDGLVAMWDGEWNAGGGVHEDAPTEIADIVGNSPLSIVTPSAVQIGSNYFSPNNIYGGRTVNTTTQVVKNAIENGSATIDACCICNEYGGGATPFRCDDNTRIYSSDNYVLRWLLLRGSLVNVSGASMSVGTAGTFSIRIGGEGNAFFRDGSYALAASVGTRSISDGVSVGDSTAGKWRFYSVRIYNRALTAAEIAANYAIDKARFNLP